MGLVAALVVIAGYAAYEAWQKGRLAKAESEISSVVASKQGAERLTALTAMLPDTPAGARDAVNLEIARTALELKDYAKAATAWGAVSADAPAPMRVVSGLGLAAALFQSGSKDKALAVLENLNTTAPRAFSPIVSRQIAVTAEAVGDWQKALDGYEALKTDATPQNQAFLEAKISELRGKIEKKPG